MLEICDYTGVTLIWRFWKWYLRYSILDTTTTYSVFSAVLYITRIKQPMALESGPWNKCVFFAPDCLRNLDKDIYCVLAQFLYL